MNEEEESEIKVRIVAKEVEEARLLRELRAVRDKIEEEKRKLEENPEEDSIKEGRKGNES